MSAPEVGKDVVSWCTKCKMMLDHTIEAVDGDKIKRVHCNTCQAQHVHRAQKPGTKKAKSRSTKTAGRPQGPTNKSKASDYERYLEGRDPSSARRYSMRAVFAAGELIEHPKFGLGVTVSLKDTTKIEVLFPDGPRTLVHAR